MRSYLLLRACTQPLLLLLLTGQARHWFHNHCFFLYFIAYWLVYLASAILLYFVSLEIFRHALSNFPGLLRMGNIAFRWAALVSLILSLASSNLSSPSVTILVDFSFAVMRSVSVLELCLLAFLCICMNALRISVHSISFGFALGFGILSASDSIIVAVVTHNPSLNSPIQYIAEGFTLLTLVLWTIYCLRPEPRREPWVIPANSTLYRWNEIAAALGHSQTKVAVQQPATGFFLSDVEQMVDKVMARNLPPNPPEHEADSCR